MPGWLVVLGILVVLMVLGSVMLLGLAALTASNSDRTPPPRKDRGGKNGNPSDRPKGGA